MTLFEDLLYISQLRSKNKRKIHNEQASVAHHAPSLSTVTAAVSFTGVCTVSDRSKPWLPLGAIRVQLPEGTHFNSSQGSPMVTAFLPAELRMGRKAVPSSCLGVLMGTPTTNETRE